MAFLATVAASIIIGTSPWFLAAVPASQGAWTGYEATIQFRTAGDILSLHVWPGGFLSDGTFVQNGLTMPAVGSAYGNSYAVISDSASRRAEPRYGLRFLYQGPIRADLLGTWWTFGATYNANNRDWVFYLIDPSGVRHTQGAYVTRAARLAQFLMVTEIWADPGTPFPTQAVRNVRLRDATGHWSVPKLRYDSSCRHEVVTSRTQGNIVFAWQVAACAPKTGWLW